LDNYKKLINRVVIQTGIGIGILIIGILIGKYLM